MTLHPDVLETRVQRGEGGNLLGKIVLRLFPGESGDIPALLVLKRKISTVQSQRLDHIFVPAAGGPVGGTSLLVSVLEVDRVASVDEEASGAMVPEVTRPPG